MKKIFYLLVFLANTVLLNAQNVGIGVPVPTEKLDVKGNINLTGTIKANGADGAAGQVLMKNSSGNLAWGDFNNYKHVIGFQATTFTQPSTIYNWNVPAGVTQILVEVWGGGGGGGVGGGGGGGYAVTEMAVTQGSNVNINIGGGGFGASSAGATGSSGNTSTVTVGIFQIFAYGGSGGAATGAGYGGDFNTNTSVFNPFGQSGECGALTTETFGQYNATTWFTAVKYGSGGNGGNSIHANKNGGFKSFNTSTSFIFDNYFAMPGNKPGGGGGGDANGGSYGGIRSDNYSLLS